jgi:flagellar motor protein MotB
VGAAIAGAFTATQLVTFFRATVDGIDALNDLADATGSTIENISALEDAAARTGTALDTVGSAMVKLNQVLQGAREGSAAAEALERIGLNAAELRRLDPAVALQRTAVALAGFADDGNKARLVQELFGKSVREVAPLLKDLAESGELVATVTAEQAAEADKFNKQLAALGKEATDLARDLSGPLVKGLNDFFDAINRARRSDDGLLGTFGKTLQADFLRARLVATNEELERLGPAAQRAQEILARQPDSFRAKARLAEFAALQRAADDYRRKIDEVMGYARGSRRPANEGGGRVEFTVPAVGDLSPPGRNRPAAATAVDPSGVPIDPLLKSALELVEGTSTQRLGQLQLQLQGLFELGGSSPTPAVVEALQKVGAAINELTPGQRELRARQSRIDELTAGTPSGQRKQVLEDIELINEAYADGSLSVEAWAEAQVANTARLPKEVAVQLEELSAITRQFQSNVQNVLGDNIASALQGDFDSIEDAWKTMLLNMVAQATAADLTARIFGKDGRSGWLGDLSKVFGGLFAKGGAFSQGQPITAFADGGVLTRPTFFGMGGGRMGVAGEAGYEGILPLRRGPGGRLGVEAYGGGGTTNIYNVAAGVTRAELMSSLQLMRQQTRADIMAELRAARVI